ncbi:MAG TPA: 3-deoxy-manno-octulosonate cytidylyltransferase [Acidobacteriaceae bacterium]|nr:3-deoxy-manno-octulosonate cytidylyltransferase [Acidobacteriaceae bacterium]
MPPQTRILAVIPARLASTRLPRKVLRDLNGQPLLAWTVEAALRCPQLSEVLIAADSEQVAHLCSTRGWPCLMTSPDLPSGSDRLFAVARHLPADIYVNIQADEPLLQPAHIEALLRPFARPEVHVTTLRVRCPEPSVHDPNVVKVVTTPDDRALYFSRAPIPFHRDAHTHTHTPAHLRTGPAPHPATTFWKHLGLYAFRAAALARFAALTPSPLEQTERLEQLRLLENGIALYAPEVTEDTIGVDTEEDLHRVSLLLPHQPLCIIRDGQR